MRQYIYQKQQNRYDFNNFSLSYVNYPEVKMYTLTPTEQATPFTDFSHTKGITFICAENTTTVLGDYGRWGFTEEIQPTPGMCKTLDYWVNRVEGKYPFFNAEESFRKLLRFEDEAKYSFTEAETYWFEKLKTNIFRPVKYRQMLLNEKTNLLKDMDLLRLLFIEDIPFELKAVCDAYNEICVRLGLKQAQIRTEKMYQET